MKNYYEILGIDEEVTQEEIRARWAELTKLYHPDVLQNPEADDRIKEINEAYQVLKEYSTRLEYDLERALRRSVLKKTEERKKYRRRKILLPTAVATGVILAVIGSYLFFFKEAQVHQESIKISIPPLVHLPEPARLQVAEPKERDKPDERYKREERAKRAEVAKVVPKEPVKVVTPEPRKVVEPKKPEERAKRDERKEPEKRIERDKRVEIAKVAPREPPRVVVPDPPQVVEPKKPEERTKREEPVERDKRDKPDERKEPEKPVEVAKIAPREPPRAVIPEPPKVVEPKKSDERVKREELNERTKREEPDERDKRDERKERVLREEEVKRFFAGYAGKYNQKDVAGFLSFFSARAVQNQKYGMDKLKNVYAGFFEQSQELRYQLKDMQVESNPNGLEVKARYELNQVLKEGGEKKAWRGQARWVLVKENGVLKILSLDYQHQK
jgi:curved DNA-binding protein CbpA